MKHRCSKYVYFNEEVKMKQLTQEDIMQVLDKVYDQVLNGIEKVSPPVEKMAEDYLSKNKDIDSAARSFTRYQVAKCTVSGFLTGFGGIITLPVAIPANIGSVIYVQMRMISCIAYMGGYDIKCDQVQTLVYACLAGIGVDQILKKTGVKVGEKVATNMIKKIPGSVITKINQKVGGRFLTKFGQKGIINLGKMIPAVGAVIGGGFDFVETKIIANRAYKMFIKGDFTSDTSENDEEIEIIEDVEFSDKT